MVTITDRNAAHIHAEMEWLAAIIAGRYRHFHGQLKSFDPGKISPPRFTGGESVYSKVVKGFKLEWYERFVIALAMVPHARPYLLDEVYQKASGKKGEIQLNAQTWVPTLELALFLLAGDSLSQRFQYLQMFEQDAFLVKNHVIQVERDAPNTPRLQGKLALFPEYVSLFTIGREYIPEFGASFPAQPISTELDWSDLVLDDAVMQEVMEIRAWLEHGDTLMETWGMKKRLAPGFRAFFYGPPGTGKTLTAALLGKSMNMPVYRVDLSMVISKYIGETEKNLSQIFNVAANKNWILFFDEADALFGKRTEVKDAHDRYANQEVAYLLQRVEDFPGLVILSTNMISNLDEAFMRRFQVSVSYTMPDNSGRLQLWTGAVPRKAKLAPDVSLEYLAENFEISGGGIMNVIRYAALKAIQAGDGIIRSEYLLRGVRREFAKEGRSA